MHNCPICQKYFTHDGNLQAHIKAVHYGEKRQRRTNKFKCEICFKSLCSKRSYDEHKNTHFNCRPFKCSMCPYAAASQMTLRRHNLRQHVSKKDWHYRCPYCPCAFVEPTSYQSHIQHKHPGFSGTFGCDSCPYSTLSSKIFLQHMMKHSKGEIMPSFSHQSPSSSSSSSINNFRQPIRFENFASFPQTPPPAQFFVDQSSSILALENSAQVPHVGGQQIVASSSFCVAPPPPPLGSGAELRKNSAHSGNNVNRFLIDDDLGQGYAAKKKFSPESASNPGLRNNNDENFDDDDDDDDTSTTSSMTSSDDDDDDFDSDASGSVYDLMDSGNIKFTQSGISSTYFDQKNIKLEPQNANFSTSTIPEACFQVEIESSFASHCDFVENVTIDEQMLIFKTTMAKDLGNDVLPDGQVDFDLD